MISFSRWPLSLTYIEVAVHVMFWTWQMGMEIAGNEESSFHCLSRGVKSSRVSGVNSQEQILKQTGKDPRPEKKLGDLSSRK